MKRENSDRLRCCLKAWITNFFLSIQWVRSIGFHTKNCKKEKKIVINMPSQLINFIKTKPKHYLSFSGKLFYLNDSVGLWLNFCLKSRDYDEEINVLCRSGFFSGFLRKFYHKRFTVSRNDKYVSETVEKTNRK